jgi:hypothetical protein
MQNEGLYEYIVNTYKFETKMDTENPELLTIIYSFKFLLCTLAFILVRVIF